MMIQSTTMAYVHPLNEDGAKGAVVTPCKDQSDMEAACRVPSEMGVNKSLGSCEC